METSILTVRLLGREWLANARVKGSGGAQAKLLEDVKDEPWSTCASIRKNGHRYGGMTRDELV